MTVEPTAPRPVGRIRAGVLVALVALAAVVIAPTAPAGAHTARRGPAAFVRGAHLSPDTAAVDVYLTAFQGGGTTLWLSNVGYGDVSSYRRLPAGTYAVAMRPHGAARSTHPVLSWTIRLTPGRSYTAYAIGNGSKLHGAIVGDSATPPSGRALVRVIQASDRSSSVDVSVGGTSVAHDSRFGSTTGYVAVPAGRQSVSARAAGGASGTTASVDLRAGSVTTLAVLDRSGGGLSVRALLNAAGAAQMPTGAIDAGGGGTSRAALPVPAWLIATAFAGALAALTAGLGLRRRARRA